MHVIYGSNIAGVSVATIEKVNGYLMLYDMESIKVIYDEARFIISAILVVHVL